jgi:hypothetical protein
MWRIGWARNNASKWQLRFKSVFKGLILKIRIHKLGDMPHQIRPSFNPALIRTLLDKIKKNAPPNIREQNKTNHHTKQK